jgi:hypothetical protein
LTVPGHNRKLLDRQFWLWLPFICDRAGGAGEQNEGRH